MPSQRVRIIAEFPVGMRKLSKQEANSLKSIFRTEFANVLGAEAAKSVASLEFQNVTNPPSGSKGAKKSKKSAKKSSKKG